MSHTNGKMIFTKSAYFSKNSFTDSNTKLRTGANLLIVMHESKPNNAKNRL